MFNALVEVVRSSCKARDWQRNATSHVTVTVPCTERPYRGLVPDLTRSIVDRFHALW